MRTQLVIIGGGPSGLLLSQLLHLRGIESIVLERRTRAHVLSRIRAGVLEQGLMGLLKQAGVDTRMLREGIPHHGTLISYDDEMFRIDFKGLTGSPVMVYGQTEVTKDLNNALDAAGQHNTLAPIVWKLRDQGIRVSLFIEADERQLDAALKLGAEVVEFHTGEYAHAHLEGDSEAGAAARSEKADCRPLQGR